MEARTQLFDLGRSFFSNTDYNHFMPQAPGAFKSEHGESAAAGYQAVSSHLTRDARHLLDEPPLGRSDELEQFLEFGAGRYFLLDPLNRLRSVQAAPRQHPKGNL